MELEKAKQILNTSNDLNLTDKEITQLIYFLEVIAQIAINNVLKERKNEQRTTLCSRIHRRAS